MNKNCILIPKVTKADGTEVPSILYRELSKNKNLRDQRPLVNYIYAQYLSNGEAALDAAGYTARDENGQHLWQDVYKFYGITDILTEQADERGIRSARILAGAIDSSGNPIYYVNGKEALDKVNDFNSKNKSLVAKVTKEGNQYSISVEKRDSRTQWQIGNAEEQARLLQTATEAFNAVGYNLEDLMVQFPEIFNVTNLNNTIDYLRSFQKARLGYATQREIEFMLNLLQPTDTKLVRILTKWGTIDNAAKAMYDNFKGTAKLTAGEESLIANALVEAKKMGGIDLVALQKQLKEETKDYKETSESYHISKILKDFREKYKIDDRGIFVVDREIKSLSQAAGNAAITLNRRLRDLEKRQGVTTESKTLQRLINTLLQEIDRNRYFHGLVAFTAEAEKHIEEVSKSLETVSGTPGSREYTQNMAAAIMSAKRILNAYDSILDPLSRADSFEKEEGITSDNLKAIMDVSSKLSRQIAYLKDTLKTAEKGVILDILRDWMGWGNELPDGRTVASLLNTLTDDVSIIEYLYSACRSSNPLLASLGTITRNAQDNRNILMMDYNTRISRATTKLKRAGVDNTRWMYDGEGRIINPYDWAEFSKQYKKVVKELRNEGLKGIDFKIALQDRINTELTQEVVVDSKSGRTERVPIFMKEHNPIDNLSDAQRDYYNEIMQIKGEFGTMLPDYARSQFLPPQVRSNSLFDAKGWKDAIKRLGSNVADAFRITESDIDFAGNLTYVDTIDGDAIIEVEADYDDSPMKDIPVYHIRKLQDQSKLITDFSGALQHLGSTAINYKCMGEIEDTALLISDFLSEQRPIERRGDNTVKADVVEGRRQLFAKRVGRYLTTTSTAHIAEGYIDREFYGEKLKDSPKIAKIVQTLLNYTRFKQLATNIPGGFSNYLVGEYQMILEGIGKDNFNLGDYAWANMMLFGDNTIKAPGRIMDYLTNNITEVNTLIGNLFDPIQETFSELGHKRYNGKMRNLFSLDYSGAVYGIGENLIHYTVMYAMLHNEKVFLNGEKVSLYDAFEKTTTEDGNAALKLKNGVKLVEKNEAGEEIEGRDLTDIDDQYIMDFRQKIRNVNQECHGAMNSEDRGIISQRLAGRLAMQFRQWMVEHYSRRYRGVHWDGSSKQWTEGWWVTAAKFLGMNSKHISQWSWKSRLTKIELNEVLNDYQKELQNRTLSDEAFKSLEQKAKYAKKQLKNLRMAAAELAAVALMVTGTTLWWNLDDDEDNPILRFLMYQSKRLTWDVVGGTPLGATQEALSLIERPTAAIPNLSGIPYIMFFGFVNGDVASEYKTGMHKGENKYLVKSARYLPLYKDIENWEKMYDNEHKDWHDMVTPFDLGRSATR